MKSLMKNSETCVDLGNAVMQLMVNWSAADAVETTPANRARQQPASTSSLADFNPFIR